MLLHCGLTEVVQHVGDGGDLLGISVDGFNSSSFRIASYFSRSWSGKPKPIAKTAVMVVTCSRTRTFVDNETQTLSLIEVLIDKTRPSRIMKTKG